MNKVALRSSDGLKGNARYKLLVDHDSILRVEPEGGKVIEGGKERIMKAKLPELIPSGSKAHLALDVILECDISTCALRLLP